MSETGTYSERFQARRAKRKRKSGKDCDPDLLRAILYALESLGVKSVVDIGAGTGDTARAVEAEGYTVAAYDGCQFEGYVQEWDLSKPYPGLERYEAGLFIEVGEHIPANLQANVIRGIEQAVRDVVIVSWAVPGQRGSGHINCREPEWVEELFAKWGWVPNWKISKNARGMAGGGWKNKLFIFERQK